MDEVPKFGFARVTDVVGYWRRKEKISLEEGAELIKEFDHQLDQRVLEDFLNFTGYSDKEFWEIVEKHRNTDLFKEIAGEKWVVQNDFENTSW